VKLGDEFVYHYTDGQLATNQYTLTTTEIIRYVGREYSNGTDLEQSLTDGTVVEIPLPDAVDMSNVSLALVYKIEATEVVKRRGTLNHNLKSVYLLIVGQCSPDILQKVKAQQGYLAVSQARDPIGLLALIRSVMFSYNSNKYRALSILETMDAVATQTRNMSTADYMQQFRTQLDVLKAAGGDICLHPGMIEDELELMCVKNPSDAERKEATTKARDRFEGMLFLFKCYKGTYGALVQELKNDYNKGSNNYPESATASYDLLIHDDRSAQQTPVIQGSHAVAFNTVGETGAEVTGVTASATQPNRHMHITCRRCGKQGHFADKCKEFLHANGTVLLASTSEGTAGVGSTSTSTAIVAYNPIQDTALVNIGSVATSEFMMLSSEVVMDGTTFKQHQDLTGQPLPRTWILLDSQSTVDVFCNRDLLSNIRVSDTECRISCNAGVVVVRMIGDLGGYPSPVWYHPDGIANILSLHRVTQHFAVSYDSHQNNGGFMMTRKDGTVRVFKKSIAGLHYCDTVEYETTLINTVSENKARYTERAFRQALLARRLQNIIGRPSTRDFSKIVEGNMLRNCPVTKADILAAEDIFGPNLGSLKGKTGRTKSDHVPSLVADLPYNIIKTHRNVILGFDIMFVNKIAFLVTISRNVKFGTITFLTSRRAEVVGRAMVIVIKFYRQRGFRVQQCNGDGEFEVLRADLADVGAQLNIAAENEHVPEVERYIRTLKERTRATYNTLPFKRIPHTMMVEMVRASCFWLNMFPAHDGVSNRWSPRQIMTGQCSDYNLQCQLEFGEYAQVHESHNNSMLTRTTGAIAMRPSGNLQGGYFFLSLTTGRVLNRNAWTVLPMPAEVIERVEQLAQGNRGAGDIQYAWRNGVEIEELADDADDLHDVDYDPNNDSGDHSDSDGDDDDDPGDYSDGDGDDDHDSNDPNGDRGNMLVDEEVMDYGVHGPDGGEGAELDDGVLDRIVVETVEEDDDNDDDDVVGSGGVEADVAAMELRYGPRHREGLRERKLPRTAEEIKLPRSVHRDMANLTCAEELALTQYNLRQGIRIYGDAALAAVAKEMQQLHDRKTISPRHAHVLSEKEKRGSLNYLMFIKKKRDGIIKGRGCADGRKQRLYKTKAETSSPTVRTESLLLSCVIDAKEERKVMTCDVPGAFMQVDIDEVVHVKLEGAMVDALVAVDPKLYASYVVTIRGKKVIYLQLEKALYGTVTASMLFWKDLSGHLLGDGFVANPYDSCVMNKEINGKQCTVLWHVDDLKISHVDGTVVEGVYDSLNQRYGKETPLTVTRGDLHEYLGMTLDFSEPGKVAIRMEDYIEGVLEVVGSEMAGVAATPAAEHLFTVSEEAPKLSKDEAEIFHSITAKLLFLCKRGRPDIQTAVAFLCTRVQHPDVDDKKKLNRVIRYLRHTKTLALTLEAENLQMIKWWVDASFAVHQDMRSHTGGTMSLGKGSIYSASVRQKLNTKSSTEAELVGVDDMMSMVLWTRQFMEGQGYDIATNVIYQDNTSAILLEKYGQQSSTKRTRHLDIRYFFVTDRIHSEELTVEYCPTGEMWADLFTKPLQGAAFVKFRKLILNLKE